MSYVIADRVKETTNTTGPGTITLAGAAAQFQSFGTGIGNGNTCDYCILSGNGTDWETGRGTVGSTTLSRDVVYASSTGGYAISLSGTSTVYVTITAVKISAADFDDVNTGITAAGSNQGGATALVVRQNYVSTGIDGTHGVRISSTLMTPGDHIYVANEDATNTLVCYPDTGITINAQSANVAVTGGILANTTALFIVKNATSLRTVP
jgi:hypothetical protein